MAANGAKNAAPSLNREGSSFLFSKIIHIVYKITHGRKMAALDFTNTERPKDAPDNAKKAMFVDLLYFKTK